MKWAIITVGISFFLIMLSGCISTDESSELSWQPMYDIPYEIKEIQVIDGDTLRAENPNGDIITVRFLGIDCPEIRSNNEHEYRSIIDTKCLDFYGREAKNFTRRHLENRIGYIVFDKNSGLLDTYDRYLCYVFNQTMSDINLLIIDQGYARVYEKETFEKKQEYLEREQIAADQRMGLWSCQ